MIANSASPLCSPSQPCNAPGSRLEMPKYHSISCTSVGTFWWYDT